MIKTAAVAIALVLSASAPAHEGATQHKKAGGPISTEENAFGREGDPKKVSRTINVKMSDGMRYFVLSALLLAGCSTTPDIVLRNGAGVTARCEGFFVASGWGRSQLLKQVAARVR